jgi:RNA polymerase sigma factor (sigma-70 family)
MKTQILTFHATEPGHDSLSIESSPAIVGRASDVTCSVARDGLSRTHARMERGSTGWTISDLDSTNGTSVNWVRLEPGESVPIQEGDVVGLGAHDYVARLSGPSFDQRPPPPPREEISKAANDGDFQTRGSLLLRLGDDDTRVREVSWQDFYDQYVPVIRGFARNAGCPKSAIEDIVHEVMTGFYRAAERFEYDAKKGRFRGYLKRATLNALRTRHRKVGRLETVDFDAAWLQEDSVQTDALWTCTWRETMFERALTAVREVTRLKSQSFDAFELCAVRGVPVEEAARQLGISPAATQKAKNRVAVALREELERIRLEEG